MQNDLDALRVPSSFARYDSESSADALAAMELFKNDAEAHLVAVQRARAANQDLSAADHARIVIAVAPFDADEPWASDSARAVAQEILAALAPADVAVVRDILLNHVRPAFSSTPHPSVNLATGRKLARPIGGVAAAHDMYDEQPWKTDPSLPAVVYWCATNIESVDYEQLWHLLIPPLMTLFDDYDLRYKIWGARIAASMLERVPQTLLRRSGIDTLLEKSMIATFQQLHNPETAALLHISIPAYLTLVERYTEADSSDRLDKLFDLLGNHIIGTIWIYAARDADTIEATVDVLPRVVRSLGISTCRFLKALVPQLLYPLTADQKMSPQFTLSSITALEAVMLASRPRVHTHSEVIFTSICRCWVRCVETPNIENCADIQAGLASLLRLLLEICPALRQDAIRRVYDADRNLFHVLLSPVAVE